MTADTDWASQLMYAVAKARTARAGEEAPPDAVCGGGGADGYSCVACARSIAEDVVVAWSRGASPRLAPQAAIVVAHRAIAIARRALTAPPGDGRRTRPRS
jgi:hypothetical protein